MARQRGSPRSVARRRWIPCLAAPLVALWIATLAVGCKTPPPGQLEVYGPYIGPEADIFGEVVRRFEADTGVRAQYIGSGDFQDEFRQRARSSDLPDVALLPQPALLSELIGANKARALPDADATEIRRSLGDEWMTAIGSGEQLYAVPYRFVVKSLVWYRSDIFAERGYQVPATLDDLDALVDQILADGLTPWCSGMDASTATGWWATDWVEDLVLRRAGPDVYRSWARLDTAFDDPAITAAMAEFQGMLRTQGAFRGGSRAVLTTAVEDAMTPMFANPPACLMHKQASFQALWLPPRAAFGKDGLGVFPLPPATPGPAPLVVSGEVAAAMSDNPAAGQFLHFLMSEPAAAPWRRGGGTLMAMHLDDKSDNALDEQLANLVRESHDIVFDASDSMPPEIGTGSFFDGMVDLVSGTSPTEVGARIQRSVEELPLAR